MSANWIKSGEGGPDRAGHYLVANDSHQSVAMARWQPRLKAWKFPSAAMRFDVTHWRTLPNPPEAVA